MAIRVERNNEGNCINFHGSSNPTYWNSCLTAYVDDDFPDTINVVNDIITAQTGTTQYEFFRIPYTEFTAADNSAFASAQACADYITANANVIGLAPESPGTDLTGVTVCFELDDTNTSIILDNGYSFGVNTIKAVAEGGNISLKSISGDRTIFSELDHTNVCVNDNAVSGGLNDVINVLNELFTVGPFTSVVITDPYSTMVADVDGEAAGYTLVGSTAVDPIGDDIFTNSASGNYAGLKSTATINQAGEYFTFDIRGEGQIGFGLVHSQASYDNGYYSGNSSYANPTTFAVSNSAHYGYQFSHWFHPTPNGSWTNYGANTSYSMRPGWSNFNGTDEQADWLAGNPIKVRVGIDNNGFISIETLRNGTDWVVHSRTSYPVSQGSEFHLGIKTANASGRVFTEPKVHLLEEEAPTLYYRYIESPDNNFEYPLFVTAEEANYVDTQNGGSGTSHTHTYEDDPTNTTWYMPDTGGEMTGTAAPTGQAYTEITSYTNAQLTPSAFTGNDFTYEEGTVVNLQLYPAGATWTQSLSISPSGSGLVYNTNTGYLQGTLSDVTSDTVYTVTVTRANSYGSSTGSFTITSTDVAPVQTNDTPWTKALDFSGSNEHLKQVNSAASVNAMKMTGIGATSMNNFSIDRTSAGTYARPWMSSIVFKSDRNSSNQHIWNIGEGAGSTDDNIYLRTDSAGNLYFGWGRGSNNNECRIATGINSSTWYGVYVASKGGRFNSTSATATNLAAAFDIRLMSSSDGFNSVGSNLSTSSNWLSTGKRMDRSIEGELTIGGRGGNRSFHGKVASMVVTTLRKDKLIPTDAEIKLIIADPKQWEQTYRVGQPVRSSSNVSEGTYNPNSLTLGYFGTQIWLMGDGSQDSYANGVRNEVYTSDQNYTKLQLNSMVSNDIETVNIAGLT